MQGHRTNNAVESGKLNDVFSSISDVDHARSAFDLVKLYPAVATEDASRLQDAHVFIADQPDDPLVSTLLVESPLLRDDSVLSDMLNMMTDAQTKFHGSAFLTQATTADGLELHVERVTRSLAPTVTNRTSRINIKPINNASIYSTQVIVSYGVLREINMDVPDLLTARPIFFAEYRYFNGQSNIYNTITLEQWQLELVGTTVKATLYTPVGYGESFNLYYISNKTHRWHDLTAGQAALSSGERVVPGFNRLKKQGSSTIYTDDGNGRFIANGYIFALLDYNTGAITEVTPIDYNGSVNDNLGLLIQKNDQGITSKTFNVAVERFARDSLYIRCKTVGGSNISASSDTAGNISGSNISGTISPSGYVELQFSTAVQADSISYDIDELSETTVPSPPGGIDRSKLPSGGFVRIFHEFNLICLQNRVRTAHPSLTSGQTVQATVDSNYVDIVDNNGKSLYSNTDDNYSYDKASGIVTIKAGISAFAGPFVITCVQSELVLIDKIDGNTLRILSPLGRTYLAGATVSSVYVLGDLQALSRNERSISAWQNNFDATGPAASSAINTTQYPIELSNVGAIAQRWAVVFTSSTAFTVIGEHVGTIYSGDTLHDCSPINPFALSPYFTLRKEAFGAGLNPGEAFLFETNAASKPVMVTRTVSPGHTTIEFDNSTLAFRGNKD
ncbi:hypothetical protein [Pseudoalteromonas xiamenensis]